MSQQNKRVLGKGLGAIISSSPQPAEDIERVFSGDETRLVEIPIGEISPNPDQPRTHFDQSEIEGLAESIKSTGLLQPIIVRKNEGKYFVVAGERRLRASKRAGLSKIKSVVIEANEEQNLSIALIENVQRQNLDPIEEAKAYSLLINRFNLKQSDVAHKVGKGRESIANSIRLLNLPLDVQEGISESKISVGHAKVLLSLDTREDQSRYFKQIISKGLSVRALETILSENEGNKGSKRNIKDAKPLSAKEAHIRKMEDKLRRVLGTKVEIRHSGAKGKIEISYYSLEDFERIIEKFV